MVIVSAAAGVVLLAAAKSERAIESQYGRIEIRRTDEGQVLLIDGLPQTGLPRDAVIAPWEGLRHGYLVETALLAHPEARDALIIGLGAALAPRLLEAHGVRCLSVEIDPAVVEVARREFGFEGKVAVADGRRYLAGSHEKWDLIVIDVCTSERLPWHIFTAEGLRAARARLKPDGLVAIQFIGDDGPWSAALYRTVRHVFGSAVILAPRTWRMPVGPRLILAGLAPITPPGRERRDERLPWEWIVPRSKGPLLTDDHFPAEMDWARTAALWRRIYGFGKD